MRCVVLPLFVLLIVAAWGCGSSSSGSSLEEISEIDGATGIAVDSSFAYSFSTPIDSSTLTTANFFIVATPAASASIAKSTDSATCDATRGLGATAGCESSNRCTLTPSKHLSGSKGYTICMTEAIRYATGEPFEGRMIAFTTGDGRGDYAGDRAHFSDGDYRTPDTDARAARLANVDGTATRAALSDAENIQRPTAFRGSSLSFDACPTGSYVTGNYTQEILVPDDFTTIQAAVDSADDYQTIVVSEGSYTENVRVRQKFLHIVSADLMKEVKLSPADATRPTITFDCNGGGLVRGISFEGGSVAVKADATTKGLFSVMNSDFYNVETGIMSNGNEVLLSENDFTLLTKDGIDLFKSTGHVVSNTFKSVDWTAIYSEGSSGLDISANAITSKAGQASVIARGGAASIDDNVFPLGKNGLGIFAEYDDNAPNAAIEICGNTITEPAGAGILIFGSGGEKTVANICNNKVEHADSAETNAKLEWLAYTSSNGEKVNEYKDGYIGIAVEDAKADASGNEVGYNTSAILYKRSCGSISGNSVYNNYWGIGYYSSDDADGCSVPTVSQNTCTNSLGMCLMENGAFGIPPPPTSAPLPQSP